MTLITAATTDSPSDCNDPLSTPSTIFEAALSYGKDRQVFGRAVRDYPLTLAKWICREALRIYGGMGYAEETAVSRHYVDARVLSIFEGAEEMLAIRVVDKALAERRAAGTG
jgi:alkylation response protein AidB-like acyl-CoA dehydrogenase